MRENTRGMRRDALRVDTVSTEWNRLENGAFWIKIFYSQINERYGRVFHLGEVYIEEINIGSRVTPRRCLGKSR